MNKTIHLLTLILAFVTLLGCATTPAIPHNQNLSAPEVSTFIELDEEVSFIAEFGITYSLKRTWHLPSGKYIAVAENSLGTYYQRENSEIRFEESGSDGKITGGIYVQKNGITKQVYYILNTGMGASVPLDFILSPKTALPAPSSVIPTQLSTNILIKK